MVVAKMIAHLIGNGASYTLYTPQQGTIIGFNVPKHNWHVDYIVVIDTMASRAMSKQDIKPRATVWCHTDVLEQATHNKHYPEMFDPVFGDKAARPRRYNGGHTVVDYIINKAAALFSQRVVADVNLYQILENKAQECRAYALEYETQQGDYTFFGHPRGGNYYQSYKPFHALYR